MAGVVRLSPDELRSKSQTYDRSANEIDQILSTLTNLQNELHDIWEGQAMQQFEAQFGELKPKVQSFSDLLNQIGGQLRDVAQIVEETDQQIAGKMGFQ
ncbi:WXG100 family type VII secretion target [Listeria booriae]|uniref:ESAT-6-like protein n=3 Tax=Listeria TaxID=1637 RepID=A0A7X0XQG0_9LIST|nr:MULTISPECIES: WXG100 family type VII secretion target [Listeria]MBC1227587.1 WXG100 family type VII secretion target [Listeria booriae]MBC1501828.1 WXG100 family type VII secretion target [Listeria weihenstephanensis]MBC1502120.1 WXG100 family type VII secretion target [Listeria weihenstephanensis]MBC1778681.1 WXG100 family type VII secretion target [Listeria booriae]MBC2002610.1 WXG100 family type VII secretion target [Listeria booriae]